MALTATIDTRGLQFVIGGLEAALIGFGGDCSEVTKDESRLLAMQVSKVARPPDRKKTLGRIEKSVRNRFQALNESAHQEKAPTSGINWLHWDNDYLYGVSQERNMKRASAESLADIYYASKMRRVGGAYLDLPFIHPHRRQRVKIYQKIVTSNSSLNRAVKAVQQSIGKLAASWVGDARTIDGTKPTVAPAWVERHLRGTKTSKSIVNTAGLMNSESPSVEFGSKAKGVNRFERAINFAVGLREKKVAARLRLILSGYSKDVAAGIKAQRRGKVSHES